MAAGPEDSLAAAVLLGEVIKQALAESFDVDRIVSENGNGTWYEVAMDDGTLVQVTIQASRRREATECSRP